MIQKHIEQIEAKLQGAAGLPESTRADLLALVSALKSEVQTLSETHAEDARFAPAEPAGEGEKHGTLESAVEGLTESVEGLETSHPQLTQLVNRLAVTLSNMGI